MNKDFLSALKEICQSKGIDEDMIFETLEAALVAGYKKQDISGENAEVEINRETGEIKVFVKRLVVEEVWTPSEEVSLEEARKLYPDAQLDDLVKIEVTPKDFGRISAMTAKQVITQRLREAERDIIYSEFNEKINNIVTGRIEKIDRGNVFIDIGKTEALLPLNEQPPGEVYEVDKMLKCYVSEVKNGARGTNIILSRTHPGFVRKLFEAEVPEIAEGIVEVKSVAREAGSRTKIAVVSHDEDIDAQGACIGPKGSRVQNIGDELGNEKIDIVKWSDDPAVFITESLSPAKVISVDIDEAENTAKIIVPENQLSLAIGKSGQNVRLAARLTGWKIDISAE